MKHLFASALICMFAVTENVSATTYPCGGTITAQVTQTYSQTCKDVAIANSTCTLDVKIERIPTPADEECLGKWVRISGKVKCSGTECEFKFEQCGDANNTLTIKCNGQDITLGPGPGASGTNKWQDYASGSEPCSDLYAAA